MFAWLLKRLRKNKTASAQRDAALAPVCQCETLRGDQWEHPNPFARSDGPVINAMRGVMW